MWETRETENLSSMKAMNNKLSLHNQNSFFITRWILGGCGLVIEVTDLIKTLMESESGHDQRESNVFSSGD